MENASKALLIAGEVLLGIILLTLFSYLFTLIAENTSRIEENAKLNRINEFNQEFLNYEGRGTIYNPLTAEDVATLINLAKDNNKKYKFYTKVEINLAGHDLAKEYDDGNAWLNERVNTSEINKKYNCTSVEIDESSKLVKKVTLENH